MLGVGLGEHHQLDVARVAAELGEGLKEVVDFVGRQGEAEVGVGGDQRGATGGQHGHRAQRARRLVLEERGAGLEVAEDGLRHPVVEEGAQDLELAGIKRREGETGARRIDIQRVGDDALDALDVGQPAEVGDVGGLRRPR